MSWGENNSSVPIIPNDILSLGVRVAIVGYPPGGPFGGNDVPGIATSNNDCASFTARTVPSPNSGSGFTEFGAPARVASNGAGVLVAAGPWRYQDPFLGSTPVGVAIWRSTDRGTTWSVILETGGNAIVNVMGVAYGNGRFVIWCEQQSGAGTAHTYVSTDNGVSWTLTDTGIATHGSTNPKFEDMRWCGDKFIAVGAVAFGVAWILTSTDGITWTHQSLPTSTPIRLFAVGGTKTGSMKVAVGEYWQGLPGNAPVIFTSPDGVSWTQRLVPDLANWHAGGYYNGVAWAHGRFVISGSEYTASTGPIHVAYSDDNGATWTAVVGAMPTGTDPWFLNAAPDMFFILSGAASPHVLWSPSGISWGRSGAGILAAQDIVHNGSQLIVIGGGGAGSPLLQASSDDGVTFSILSLPSTGVPLCEPQMLAFNGATWVALGRHTGSTWGITVWRSTDSGATWSTFFMSPVADHFSVYDLCYAAGKFVTVGWNTEGVATTNFCSAFTSPDGSTWTEHGIAAWSALASVELQCVAHNGTIFIAGGTDLTPGSVCGVIYTSSDGATWTRHVVATGSINFSSIAATPGRCVAIGLDTSAGSFPVIYTSADGSSWSACTTPWGGQSASQMAGVAYRDGRFVVVGWHSASQPLCAISDDGINWSAITIPDTTDTPYRLCARG